MESICFHDLAHLEELIDHAEDYVLCEEASELLGDPHIYCLEVRWFAIFLQLHQNEVAQIGPQVVHPEQSHLRGHLQLLLPQEETLLTKLLDALINECRWLLIWLHGIPQFVFGLPQYFSAGEDILPGHHERYTLSLRIGAARSTVREKRGVVLHDEVIDVFLHAVQSVLVHLIYVIVQVCGRLALLYRVGRLLEDFPVVEGACAEEPPLVGLVGLEVDLLRHDGGLVLEHFFACVADDAHFVHCQLELVLPVLGGREDADGVAALDLLLDEPAAHFGLAGVAALLLVELVEPEHAQNNAGGVVNYKRGS